MTAPKGLVLVITGPSGVGKSTVAEKLLADPQFGRAVTATTRQPRPGERDGVDYLFKTRGEFEKGLAAGEFLEHANVYGQLYGTPIASVRKVLEAGKTCVLVIDVQGAATLKAMRTAGRLPFHSVLLFLAPPDTEVLAQRLAKRGVEPGGDVLVRLRAAIESELAQAPLFDARVVNDDLEAAVRSIRLLVSTKRRDLGAP